MAARGGGSTGSEVEVALELEPEMSVGVDVRPEQWGQAAPGQRIVELTGCQRALPERPRPVTESSARLESESG
jgi:hypothetical protein